MLNRKSFLIVLILLCVSFVKAEDLNTKKMEKVTKEILDVFVDKEITDNSKMLRKYISNDWLEKKRINVNNYKINNYSPDNYNIIYTGGDICIAVISGASWSHLLVFKFTEEGSSYRVVPKGISESSTDYIDPWFFIKDYLCSEYNYDKDKDK